MTIVKIKKIFLVKWITFIFSTIIFHMNCIRIRCAECINLSGCRICRDRICVINYADWIRSASQLNMFDEILIIWGRCLKKLRIRLCITSDPREIDLDLFFSCYRCLCKIDFIFHRYIFNQHGGKWEISDNREVCSSAGSCFSIRHINIRLILTTGNCSAWQGNFIKLGML